MRLAFAFAALALAGAGCDGGPAPAPFEPASVGDLGAPDLAPSPDLGSSPALLHATVIMLDDISYGAGVTVRAVPPADPGAAATTTSDAAGLVRIPLRDTMCGQPVEVLAEGQTLAGLPILPTRRLPAFTPSCTGYESIYYLHLAGDDPSPTGVRTTVARELANAGVIPAADGASGQAFGQKWSWAMGRFLGFIPEEHVFTGGTITMTGDAGQCRLVYTNRWINYRGGYAPSFLDFGATTSKGGFVVICPATFHQPITLSATGFTDSQSGWPASFADVTVTLESDRMLQLDWQPYQY